MVEQSISKNHPIASLELIRYLYRGKGIKIRVRFRGPRYDSMASHCLKKNAHTFAVYAR
jgi:hypothetical protein